MLYLLRVPLQPNAQTRFGVSFPDVDKLVRTIFPFKKELIDALLFRHITDVNQNGRSGQLIERIDEVREESTRQVELKLVISSRHHQR